jgi:prolyl 4-hydroxylase
MDMHREWSGHELTKAACYGIRVYQGGSYLLNHLDRLRTHVVSSTICVDHRLHSPWPLYIEDVDGNPHEVHVEPGEMVFFEGALLKHGRPYAMSGEYYANIFLHYTPVDWSTRLTGGGGPGGSSKPL